MINKDLEKIVRDQKGRGYLDIYIRNALKEYLQVYVLYFIYTSSKYRKKLIFTGGTCLRHFYGLERLSEDLDFDFIAGLNTQELLEDLTAFFASKYKYSDLGSSLKQKGKQILLKFPVLKQLGLAHGNESDLLFVRVDISELPSENYSLLTTSKNYLGMNFVACHYDLPDLMAGKLCAILTRKYQRGKADSVKGRDYFDLLWFVKEGVKPNVVRLSDMLGEKVSFKKLEKIVDEKVEKFVNTHKSDFESDMMPLIETPEIISIYVDSYREQYIRFKSRSFSI